MYAIICIYVDCSCWSVFYLNLTGSKKRKMESDDDDNNADDYDDDAVSVRKSKQKFYEKHKAEVSVSYLFHSALQKDIFTVAQGLCLSAFALFLYFFVAFSVLLHKFG